MTKTSDETPEDRPPSALIMLDFGATGVVKHFDSWAEVVSWVKEEEKHWNWLDPNRRVGAFQDHWGGLDNLRSAAESAKGVWNASDSTDDGRNNAEAKVCEAAKSIGDARRVILQDSSIGKLIERVRTEEGEEHAVRVAAVYLDPHSQLSAPLRNVSHERARSDQVREALLRSWQVNSLRFQHSNPEVFAESIKVQLSEWNKAHQSLKEKGKTSLNALNSARDALIRKIAKLSEDASKQQTDHQEKMDAIEQDYREKMALREPVEYWSKKQSEHATTAKYWAWAALALFVGGVIGLVCFASSSRSTEVVAQVLAIEGVKTEDIGTLSSYLWLANSIRLAVLSLMLVWPLRIFIRNYISQNHLATDAAERVVTIKTYLAMLNDPALRDDLELRKNALPLALERVFQKANDGIVQDDGAPVDAVLAAIRRK